MLTNPQWDLRDRRRLILGAAALIACPAHAAPPPGGSLRFDVFHNGAKAGEHRMTFVSDAGATRVTTEVSISMRLAGLLQVRYAHQARELWDANGFASLETSSVTNGKREQVSARRAGGKIEIQTRSGALLAAAAVAPLTHWNPRAFSGALFNPQNGKLLKVAARRGAVGETPGGASASSRWEVRGGETQIDDWYDASGVWTALRGRLPDRSTMEYRPA